MSLMSYPARSSMPELHTVHVLLEGTGASAPTLVEGANAGVTVARTDTGVYTLTFSEGQGDLVGHSVSLRADTPADVAGHTMTIGTWSSNVLAMLFAGASESAHDLAADEYVSITLHFARTSTR